MPEPVAAERTREIATVEEFLGALEDFDLERALSYLAEDVVYQNVPLPPARGIGAVTKQLRLMARYGTGFEAHTHRIAASGDTVLTERTDVLIAGRWRARFWVCGTFELRDGKIVLWRDYFDWATVLASSARGWVGVLASAVRRRVASSRS
ncbi:nuclear transport factor 2 family protein [Haloechinothrix sp. YIM 98757]|uniref:Nuclear transport factor 2 family protein n=1 Tax=Haloechinothrix aidingensis TaxID=2752311 RepID=A0A838ADW5_9PSEU|nr:limonene-1,2-epoxide hydrolase family protein [Haloechinothrix aidingensis]MBA0127489.1 nuclear transport factor 2 family protein [Haloechinothrix aidingensis]